MNIFDYIEKYKKVNYEFKGSDYPSFHDIPLNSKDLGNGVIEFTAEIELPLGEVHFEHISRGEGQGILIKNP